MRCPVPDVSPLDGGFAGPAVGRPPPGRRLSPPKNRLIGAGMAIQQPSAPAAWLPPGRDSRRCVRSGTSARVAPRRSGARSARRRRGRWQARGLVKVADAGGLAADVLDDASLGEAMATACAAIQ